MQKRLAVFLCAILLIAASAIVVTQTAVANSEDNAFVGTWQGSWTGQGSGKFEMTISKGSGSKLSGTISPKPDDGEVYTVAFKSVEVSAGKLLTKFEDPNGELDIALTGTAEGKSAKGTYTVRQKSDGTEVDSGTWTATRK